MHTQTQVEMTINKQYICWTFLFYIKNNIHNSKLYTQ